MLVSRARARGCILLPVQAKREASPPTPPPVADLAPDVIDALTKRTMDGGTEVVQAGKGSAILSMAYAGAPV